MKNELIQTQAPLPVQYNMFEAMDKAYKFAELVAKSDIIPDIYKNKPANCFLAINTAFRMNLDPFLVMQNTDIIQGRPGIKATFAIALANQSRIFSDNMTYIVDDKKSKEFFTERKKIEWITDKTGKKIRTETLIPDKKILQDITVTATAILRKGGKAISSTVSMEMAFKEEWTKNPKYESMPLHMLTYRAATFLIKTHCPEILFGMHTTDELEDIQFSKIKNITPESQPLSSTEPKPSDVFDHPSGFIFIELDGRKILLEDADKVTTYIGEKIQNITTESGIEKFRKWKELNDKDFRRFSKNNRDDALDLANSFKAIESIVMKKDMSSVEAENE